MSASRSDSPAAALLRHGPCPAWRRSRPRRSTRDLGGEVKKTGARPGRLPRPGASTGSCCVCAPPRTSSCWPGAPTSSPTGPRTSTRSAAGPPASRTGSTAAPAPRHPPQAEGQADLLVWSRRWRASTATCARDAAQGAGPGPGGSSLPASWRPAEENAAVEVWLTIHGTTAVCGLRLSDRTMRHRTYKLEHRPGVAAADGGGGDGPPGGEPAAADRRSTRCAAPAPSSPSIEVAAGTRPRRSAVLGGDIERTPSARRRVEPARLGGAGTWPLGRDPPAADAGSVDRIVSNPPFGKQLSDPDEIGPLYRRMVRGVRPRAAAGRPGRAAGQRGAAAASGGARRWAGTPLRQVRVRRAGQPAPITVWQKGP